MWPTAMWADKKEGETDEAHVKRVAAMSSKVNKVAKALGAYNHLPPRGLFQDLINVEMARLVDLLVTKIKVISYDHRPDLS